MSRSRASALAVVLTLGVLAAGGGAAYAVFVGSADNPQTVTAVADFLGPSVTRSTIAKTSGYTPGYVKQAGTYYVYAQISDSGNPSSGIDLVTADVSALTTLGATTPLVSGSYSVGGMTYNYRSLSTLAKTPLAAGSYTWSLATRDLALNTGGETGLTVTVDNTAPSASDVQTTNKNGGTAGKPELGDTVTLTYSEPVDPESVLSGWNGASVSVVVRIDNNTPTNDRLSVYNAANTSQLPLGTVNLGRTDYVGANRTFGASGTASTMVMSGSTITVTLGTASGSTSTASSTGSMIWTPLSSAYDRAANAASTSADTESGTADKDF
jgi:hypothetical protein